MKKNKMSLTTELDLTREGTAEMTRWCILIALHQSFGVGAARLNKILARAEKLGQETWWRKLKQGTGVKGIFWDPALREGLGDIAIRSMDLLMLYWEPGVEDIQDSANFFSLALADNDRLTARWPQLEGKAGSSGITVGQYVSDQNIDTSEKSVVVDWYYKREKLGGQTVVHYCKFCNGVVLYASENDPAMAETGFYDHGKYPFVFDPLFVEENSPAGFGYIDVMKDTQDAIDRMTQAMDENTLAAAKKRYLISDTAGVNEDELLDTAKDVVHITGRLDERGFMELETAPLPSNTIAYQQNRVAELKEISGNRDVNQGGATSGLTAASAIAALQEAGSKLSRDTASARELRNYLYQMQEQLEYILSNIDTENLSGDLQEKLK